MESSTWSCCGGVRTTATSPTRMVDAKSPLADNGVVWLLTPKFGREGALEPADIADAAATSGLRRTTSVTLAQWQAVRLVSR